MRQKDLNEMAQVIGNDVRVEVMMGAAPESNYINGLRDALQSVVRRAFYANPDLDVTQIARHYDAAYKAGFGVIAGPSETIQPEWVTYYDGARRVRIDELGAIQESVNTMFHHLDELEISEPCS